MPDDGRPVPGGEEDTRRETFSGGLEELSDASLGSVGVRCCCEEEGGGGRGLYGAGELTNHRTKTRIYQLLSFFSPQFRILILGRKM
jgi:hypothetical protein